MAIPEPDLARIRRWCDGRVPEHLWDQVKVEADAATTDVTIVEVRPCGTAWANRPVSHRTTALEPGKESLVAVLAGPSEAHFGN
jgi:hypothetical protein